MEKMIGVINNNLRAVIDGIKAHKKETEDSLASVKATMDEKVNAANEYKKSVDEARNMITSLEDEIKDLENDLQELTVKFGDKDFKELLTAGNREINTKIIEKRALINQQSEHIVALTDKARELKDALVNLKEQKTTLEETLADLIVLEQYYETRITEIIEVAEENPDELANYVTVKPQDVLDINGDDYENIDLKQIIDGSIFQEIDAISADDVDERLVQEALDKNLNESSILEEEPDKTPIEPVEEKKEPEEQEELVDLETVEPFKVPEGESEIAIEENSDNEDSTDIELKPLELDLGEVKEDETPETKEEDNLDIPNDIFASDIETPKDTIDDDNVEEVEKEFASESHFPWMDEADEDLGMGVLTLDNTEVSTPSEEKTDNNSSMVEEPKAESDSTVENVLEIPNDLTSEPENESETSEPETIDLPVEETPAMPENIDTSNVIDLDFENNDGIDFANSKIFNDELPKEEEKDNLDLSEVGLEKARFNEDNIANLQAKYNKENVVKTLAVLNSHQLDVQRVYQDSKILTDIDADKLDKIISLLKTTGATDKDINAILPLLYKADYEALVTAVKENPTGELSDILFDVIPYNGENDLPNKLGLSYTEETTLRQAANDIEFKKLNLFADIVEANYINLNSYKVANIRECITKYPKRFLMNPSHFNEILDKYDSEDLVRCVNKNAAVIERL